MIRATSSERYVFPEKYAKFKLYSLSLLENKQRFKFRVVMTGHLTLFLAYFSVIFIQLLSKLEEF